MYAKSGNMALVHGGVIEVKDKGLGINIFHASILKRRVLKENIHDFLAVSKSIYLGFVLYELDPAWNFLATDEKPEGLLQIKECEEALIRSI